LAAAIAIRSARLSETPSRSAMVASMNPHRWCSPTRA
jgi:hypothetical protein